MHLTIEEIRATGKVDELLGDGSYRLKPPVVLTCLKEGIYPRGIGVAFRVGDVVSAHAFYDERGEYPHHVHLPELGFNWPFDHFEIKI